MVLAGCQSHACTRQGLHVDRSCIVQIRRCDLGRNGRGGGTVNGPVRYLELAHEGGFENYPDYIQDQIKGMRGLAANVLAYATNRQLHDKLDIPQYLEDDEAETPATLPR